MVGGYFCKTSYHFIGSLVSLFAGISLNLKLLGLHLEITSIKLPSVAECISVSEVGGGRGRELKADGEAQKILRITYEQPVKVKLATFHSFLRLWGFVEFYFMLPELVFS